jgi:hypothetical protein
MRIALAAADRAVTAGRRVAAGAGGGGFPRLSWI